MIPAPSDTPLSSVCCLEPSGATTRPASSAAIGPITPSAMARLIHCRMASIMPVSSTQHRAGASKLVYHQPMSPSQSQKKTEEQHSRPALREPRFMLSDLFDELIWPRVLRAPALALSPNRMLSGCVAVFLISLVLRIYDLLRGASSDDALNTSRSVSNSLGQIGDQTLDGIISLNPIAFSSAATNTATLVRDSVMHNPLLSILLGIPMVAIIALAGAVLCR